MASLRSSFTTKKSNTIIILMVLLLATTNMIAASTSSSSPMPHHLRGVITGNSKRDLMMMEEDSLHISMGYNHDHRSRQLKEENRRKEKSYDDVNDNSIANPGVVLPGGR